MTHKTLIVDGYNVLRSSSYYRPLIEVAPDHTHDAYNLARHALITDVATFAGREYAAIVVFDGAGNPSSDGEPSELAGVQVLFSPAGVSADTIIEQLARTALAQSGEVTVVTSDAVIQSTVLRERVTRMSAVGFVNELHDVHQEIDEHNPSPDADKNTLAARLDPATRAALKQLVSVKRRDRHA
jgi:predicted RNA-binding protein with PIN domain